MGSLQEEDSMACTGELDTEFTSHVIVKLYMCIQTTRAGARGLFASLLQ